MGRFYRDTIQLAPATAYPGHIGHDLQVLMTIEHTYRLTAVEVVPGHWPPYYLDGTVSAYHFAPAPIDVDSGGDPQLWCATCNSEVDDEPTVPMVPRPYEEK